MAYHRDNRLLKIKTVLDEQRLLGTALAGTDSLLNGFVFSVDLISTEKNISSKQLLHTPMQVEIDTQAGPRYFHGLISQFERGQKDGHFYHYRVELRPHLWFLLLTKNYRMFQCQSVPEIIKTLLYEANIIDFEFKLKGEYAPREYCCQYGESTYHFLHRLMEEEGIFYFYDHEKTRHKIMFVEDVQSFSAVNSPDHNKQAWYQKEKISAGKIVLTEAGFAPLQPEKARNMYEVHHYPGHFSSAAEGQKKLKLHQVACEAQATLWGGDTDNLFFAAGKQFQHRDHGYYFLNVNYYILDHSYFSHGSQSIAVSFSCLPMTQAYKPLMRTPKPTVAGVETAVVVGPKDSEIYTDKQARVKVRFHWDRACLDAQDSSCWIRVAQLSAGHGFGTQFLPRVGQEVIVQFVHGDPDRPLMMGSLFNATHEPPFVLPANKTRSGIKTHSTPHGEMNKGNELSFEDARGREEVYLHAQKDFKRVIEGSEIDLIKKGNLHISVSQGEAVIDAHKKITFKVGASKVEMDEEKIAIFAKKINFKK